MQRLQVHKLLTGALSSLRDSADLLRELRMLFKHIHRKWNELIFSKCVDPRCFHCSERPIMSKETWEFLKEREFKWANSKSSVEHPEHYLTFIEMCDIGNEYLLTGDDGMPSTLIIGKCPVFMSMAEIDGHMK